MQLSLQRMFIQTHSTESRVINNFLSVLTVVSIVSLVLETVPSLVEYSTTFIIIEWVAVIFFGLEYVGRLLTSKPKRKYVLSFFGVIDLVSIAPTLLGLGNFTFLKSARALRIIRMLRMLRLAKISRTKIVEEENMNVLSLNIIIYFATLLFALLVTGTLMYLVEGGQSAFVSIPAGMWWSLKVFLAGIPVVEPVTVVGEFFFVLTRFVGLLLLGLLIGVVGNVFRALVMGGRK